jgi:TM2 domain-containing membrane protein YozV
MQTEPTYLQQQPQQQQPVYVQQQQQQQQYHPQQQQYYPQHQQQFQPQQIQPSQQNINVINIAQTSGPPEISSGTKLVAVLVNIFLFPGLGQLIKGEVGKGLLFMTIWIVLEVITILTIPFMIGFLLVLVLLIVWIWFVVDAAL